jgi:hypothetical protein
MLCIEGVLSAFEDYLYPYPFDGLRMKIKNEVSQANFEDYDVLILGDCYNIVGVIPSVIEKETQLKCFNFSHHRNQSIAASYILFENYLKSHHHKPEFIIVTYLPEVINHEKPDFTYLYDFSHGNRIMLAREFGFGYMVKSLFASIRKQGFLKEAFFHPRSIFDTGLVNRHEFFYQVLYKDKGYYHRYEDRIYEGGNDRHFTEFYFSPFFKKYFEKINRLAVDRGIKVVYVMPAFPPEAWDAFFKEAYMDYVQYFQNWQNREKSNFVILEVQGILNENTFFNDNMHLNRKGAEALSNYLAEAIRDKIGLY